MTVVIKWQNAPIVQESLRFHGENHEATPGSYCGSAFAVVSRLVGDHKRWADKETDNPGVDQVISGQLSLPL
jgi:hypothetical protein